MDARILLGAVQERPDIAHFAERLHEHPLNPSNTFRRDTGRSPRYFHEGGQVSFAKHQLALPDLIIGEVSQSRY